MRLLVVCLLAVGCHAESSNQPRDFSVAFDFAGADHAMPDAQGRDFGIADLAKVDLAPPPPDLAPVTVTRFPQSVIECPGSFLQLDEHPVDGTFAESADDLRTGSCTPTACTTGGKQAYGIDLEFPAMLPAGANPAAASLTIRAAPANGDPATFTVFDYETGNSLGACIIDRASQVYGECSATLGPLNLLDASAPTKVYIEVTSSACSVSFDFVRLSMTGLF